MYLQVWWQEVKQFPSCGFYFLCELEDEFKCEDAGEVVGSEVGEERKTFGMVHVQNESMSWLEEHNGHLHSVESSVGRPSKAGSLLFSSHIQ